MKGQCGRTYENVCVFSDLTIGVGFDDFFDRGSGIESFHCHGPIGQRNDKIFGWLLLLTSNTITWL